MPRRRKGPRIYPRPGRSGLWVDLDRDHRRIPLHTGDEEEAHRRVADLLHRLRIPTASQSPESLADLFDLADRRSRTAHTRKTSYEDGLNLMRVLGWLEARGVTTIGEVSRAIVEDYKTARRFTVGAARINREMASWRKAMRIAVEEQGASKEVLDYFQRLREPRPAPHQRRLGKRDLAAFLRAVDARYRPLLRLVLGSAIRDEEVRHLDAEDVIAGKRERWIQVSPKPAGFCACCPNGWTTKGYRHRRVPATKETIAAAKAFLAGRDGLNLDKKRVWSVIQEGCAAAKVTPFSLHDLRKAWATGMLDAGNGLQAISRWLGHGDVQTTMRYLGIAEDAMPPVERLPW